MESSTIWRSGRVRTNLTPRFTLQRVTLRSGNPGNHQNPGSDGRLVVEVQGVQENDRHLKEPVGQQMGACYT